MSAPPVVTTDQVRDAWETFAPRFDRFATPQTMPLADQALDRIDISQGTRLLDVGCGSGGLAIPAARRGAQVTAVDLAPAMIERLTARARAEGLTSIQGRVMDAASLDLPDDAFDVAASQNGVSVMPDLAVGLRELVRVTRPGGQVLIVAFGAPARQEFLGLFISALTAVVGGVAPLLVDPAPLALQLASRVRFARALEAAGLLDVEVDATSWEMRFSSGRHFWDLVTASNPIAAQLTGGLTEAERTEVQHVLDGILRERSGDATDAVLHNEMNVGLGRRSW